MVNSQSAPWLVTEACPSEAAYMNNRAAACLMLQDYESAYRDSIGVLRLEDKNIKGTIAEAHQ